MDIRRAALIALLAWTTVPMGAATRGPDAAGYVATDATVFSFADISGPGGGASVLGGTDDAIADLTLPFSFQFYGQPYTRVCVSSNGALYFISDPTACSGFVDFANTDLTATSGPKDLPAVFPFWTDLSFQVGGAVVYQTLGVPGSRRFVVQWNKAYPFGSANPVTFQVILSEGSNNLLVQYKTVDLGPGDPSSKGAHATVGIRNHGAPTNNEQIEWSFDVPVLGDSTALLFGRDATPPTTTSSLRGPAGSNGWYQGPVQVTLSASDPDSAVAGTFYTIDGSAALRYSAPFTISEDGVHHVSYSSNDPAGNQEPAHVIDVKIDATPPAVTASATPSSLWPPNNKLVTVRVTGTITDAISGVDPSSARFSVTDSLGQVQPSGSVSVATNGSYSFTISLLASRKAKNENKNKNENENKNENKNENENKNKNENSQDDWSRTYTVAVTAMDMAGKLGSGSAVVAVPHDQGKR